MLVYTGGLIFVVSFVFAMLGLGGGMLYVPIFHWLGFGLKEVVIPLGLLLNGLNTLIALIPYGRKKTGGLARGVAHGDQRPDLCADRRTVGALCAKQMAADSVFGHGFDSRCPYAVGSESGRFR